MGLEFSKEEVRSLSARGEDTMKILETPAALENRQNSWKRRRQNNNVKKTTVIEDLLRDMLTDIFLRLPLESIIRVKFTCKLWFAIISDPLFTQIHRDRAIGNPGYLYKFCNRREAPAAIICFAETVGGQVHGMKFLFEPLDYCKSPFGFTQAYASSGGLLALYPKGEDCYYVSNPVIHEKVRVPLDPPDFNSQDSEEQQHAVWWAFGFSSSSGVYKIIHFSFPWIGSPPCYLDIEHQGQGSTYTFGSSIGNQGQGAIYTLGSSAEWKKIQNIPFRPRDKRYIDCNGTLMYCLEIKDNKSSLIGTFDILSEEFRAWKGPLPTDDENFAKSRDYYLIKMGDTVCFVHTDSS